MSRAAFSRDSTRPRDTSTTSRRCLTLARPRSPWLREAPTPPTPLSPTAFRIEELFTPTPFSVARPCARSRCHPLRDDWSGRRGTVEASDESLRRRFGGMEYQVRCRRWKPRDGLRSCGFIENGAHLDDHVHQE